METGEGHTSPFGTLTVDGKTHTGAGIMKWAEGLVDTHHGARWTKDIERTVATLTTGNGALHARTSGTTGPAKTIAIPPEDLQASAMLTAHTFGLKRGDRALICLPCAHIAGQMMLVRAMVLGLDLHVIEPQGNLLDRLEPNARFRFAAMIPLQLHRMLHEDKDRADRMFGTVLLGGGPVSGALQQELQDLDVAFHQGFGSTETITHVALRALNGPGRSDIYHALRGVHFSTSADGLLTVHTPHLSVRTHNTNDVVELLDAQHFRWLGRADNVVLSGGRKFHPEQLEAITHELLPFAHYFSAEPDDALGQALVLFAETGDPPGHSDSEIKDMLREHLDPHMMPRRIRSVPEFRRTPSGKIIRD